MKLACPLALTPFQLCPSTTLEKKNRAIKLAKDYDPQGATFTRLNDHLINVDSP